MGRKRQTDSEELHVIAKIPTGNVSNFRWIIQDAGIHIHKALIGTSFLIKGLDIDWCMRYWIILPESRKSFFEVLKEVAQALKGSAHIMNSADEKIFGVQEE